MARQQSAGYFQWYPAADRSGLITGLDISSAQGNNPNFTTMYNAGARFLYFKVSGYTYAYPTARYVRVSATGNSAGSSVIMRYIGVYNNSLGYMSNGKTVTLSKTPDSGVASNLTVNGNNADVNIGTGYQWARVDLGATQTLHMIQVRMYTGVTWKDLKVETSLDGVNWTQQFYQVQEPYVHKSTGVMFTPNTHSMYVNSGQVTAANVAAARAAGIRVGFYYFKNPAYFDRDAVTFHTTVADGIAEANLFKGHIDSCLGTTGDYGDLMPMLDWENNFGEIYPSVNDDGAYDFIEAFANTFKAATGRQTILYTAYYTNELLDTAGNQLVHSSKGGIGNVLPLWLAASQGQATYPNYGQTKFGGWDVWRIWQYSTDGNGMGATYGTGSTDIDIDLVEDLDYISRPVPPAGFNAVAGDTQVTLTWTATANDDATGYKIYRGSTVIATLTGKATNSYVDMGLNNGTAYAYQIVTTTQWEDSAKSSTVNATPSSLTTNLFPYYPMYNRESTITADWTFDTNSQVTMNKLIAQRDVKIYPNKYGFNNAAGNKYLRICRLKFISAFGRVILQMPLVHTGTNIRLGTLNGYFYESTLGTVAASSSAQMVNDTGIALPFAAGHVVYQQWKTAGLNPDYIDIWVQLSDFATFGYATTMVYLENQTSIIWNPDGATTANGVGLQNSIPIAGTTGNYEGNAVTAQAPVNFTIKTVTMT